MTEVFAPGGYRFIPAVFQYSAGVAAEPGFRIERVSFRQPIPLARGFARVAEIISARGRPLHAFCACELRSPAPFTDDGFRAFNEVYTGTLAEWGIYDRSTRRNPVARSNVCPELAPPAEPCFAAFCFTGVAQTGPASFVVAGSGEAREGGALYRERTVRYGDTSPRCHTRKGNLRPGRDGATAQVARLRLAGYQRQPGLYRARSLWISGRRDRCSRGGAIGLTWHYCRPPVRGLEYEMDCRAVAVEHFVE